MAAAGQRTTGPCGCCGACVIFADDFNRADGSWPSPVAFDPSGQWEVTAISTSRPWGTSGNTLSVLTALGGVHPSVRTTQISQAPAAAIQIRAYLPPGGKLTFQLTIQTGGDLGVSQTREQAAAEAVIAVGSSCGVLKVRDAAGSFDREIPVPGLVADAWHTLKLCLDTQTGLISATVTTPSGSYSHHVKNVTTSTTAAQLNPLIRAGIALEPVDLGYVFDDFAMSQTKGSLGGDYAYSGDNSCPCCGPSGCQEVTDDFDGASIDCRWDQTGSWTQTGGAISGGTLLTWLGGWTGHGTDCLPDYNAGLSLTFSGSDGDTITASIGSRSATLTLTATDATLTLSSGESETVSGFGTSGTLEVCWDGYSLVARAGSTLVYSEVGLDAADDGGQPAFAGSATVAFASATISFGCPCGAELVACSYCEAGTVHRRIALQINGLVTPALTGCLDGGGNVVDGGANSFCAVINGLTFILESSSGCAWSLPEDLCLTPSNPPPAGVSASFGCFVPSDINHANCADASPSNLTISAAIGTSGGRLLFYGFLTLSGSLVSCSPRNLTFELDLGPDTGTYDCTQLGAGITAPLSSESSNPPCTGFGFCDASAASMTVIGL